jgi:glycine cleavage system aminomethyltransferase T
VLAEGKQVGVVVKSVYSPALCAFISLALLDNDYALSDIDGFSIETIQGTVSARTHSTPFIYNLSLLVNPTEHSYIDPARAKSAV